MGKFIDHAVEHSRLGADRLRRADAWAVEMDLMSGDRSRSIEQLKQGIDAVARAIAEQMTWYMVETKGGSLQ